MINGGALGVEIPVSIPYQHVALLRFLLVLILACHWLACVWAMTLKLVDEKYPQWINEIEAADLPFGIQTRDSPIRSLTGGHGGPLGPGMRMKVVSFDAQEIPKVGPCTPR